MDRTTIVAGPAIVQFNSQTFYSEGDIVATPTVARFDITTSMFGKVDERLDTVVWEISFTPTGQNFQTAAIAATLWPYLNPTIGSSLFGATDKNIVIHSLAGQLLTFKAGCITGMPDIILSAGKPPVGQVTMHAIGANDTEMSDAAKFFTASSTAFTDASFDPADILTLPYLAALTGASSPWDAIDTEEGWTVSFDVAYDTIKTDAYGISDYRLQSVGVMAKCKPLGVTEAQIVALLHVQGAGVRRGMSLLDNAADLVIQDSAATVANPKVTIKNAHAVEAGYQFGNGATLRHGELGFTAIRSFTAGAAGPLAVVEPIPAP